MKIASQNIISFVQKIRMLHFAQHDHLTLIFPIYIISHEDLHFS